MAKSVNKVILLGNVGKDPEIRSTPGGAMVASLTRPPATAIRISRATGRTAPSGTTWSPSSAPLKSFAITSRKAPSSTSRESSKPAVGTTRSPARSATKPKIIVFDISLLSGREDGSSGSRTASGSSAASFDQRPPAGQDDAAQSAEISDDDIPF